MACFGLALERDPLVTVRASALRRVALVGVALAVAGALVVGALAIAAPPPVTVTDPHDVLGRMDVRRVRLDTATGTPEWTVVTFASWTIHEIWDHGFVIVYLDTKGSSRADYYALIRSSGRVLDGWLWRRPRTEPDVRLRSLRVTKGSGIGVSVWIPTAALTFGVDRASYGWWVQTLWIGDRCRRTCIDRAPDTGAVVQPLPSSSPSPSPSPSPTNTGSPSPSPSPTDTGSPSPSPT
jgi:hypothetical protein